MFDSENAIDYLEQQIPSLAAAAVDMAYWQALAAGQKVLVSSEDDIHEVFQNGTQTLIKSTEKPLNLPV